VGSEVGSRKGLKREVYRDNGEVVEVFRIEPWYFKVTRYCFSVPPPGPVGTLRGVNFHNETTAYCKGGKGGTLTYVLTPTPSPPIDLITYLIATQHILPESHLIVHGNGYKTTTGETIHIRVKDSFSFCFLTQQINTFINIKWK
jgi:hypothetical protein